MVNKQKYREVGGGPPPLDESWWQAILAEDEAHSAPGTARNSTPANQPNRVRSQNASGDSQNIDWDKASELYDYDQTIEMEVCGFNRGGLLVVGEDLQGFIPISHLVEAPQEGSDSDKFLSGYVGRMMPLKVIECDPQRGRVVFSERAALAEPGSRNVLLEQLQPGDHVTGNVTNITDFGVFVDLGGVEGLIHVSEISWGRVRHPSDVVELGQPVQVYVISVDQERARVALSIKRLYPNPWESADMRYAPGQVIEATVTSIVQFGAFARLEEGLDGLIHVSEMCPDGETVAPEDVLHEGQCVRVRILHVDGSKQRLGLSLKLEESQ
jgi:small subunit ribosomal protein S1